METFFQWRQEWALHLKQIDEQHRMLVEAVNKLAPLYLRVITKPEGNSASRVKLTGLLNLLYGDLEQHFRDEEKLMLESVYPHHKSHAHAHVMLLAELKNYCNRITSRDEELDMATLYSLKTWFITHMLDDKEFASHFLATTTGDNFNGQSHGRH